MKNLETSVADIELEVADRMWHHLPTEEVVDALVFQALDQWKRSERNIDQLLWDEKIDDKQGDKMRRENTFLTGDYITAVHLWAKGGQK